MLKSTFSAETILIDDAADLASSISPPKRYFREIKSSKLFSCCYFSVYVSDRSNETEDNSHSVTISFSVYQVTASSMEEEQVVNLQEKASQLQQSQRTFPEAGNGGGFTVVPALQMPMNPVVLPVPIENPMEKLTLGQIDANTRLVRPIPVLPIAPESTDLNLNLMSPVDPPPLSLKLSLSSNQNNPNQPSRHSAFQAMSSFNNGDNIISCA